MASGPLVGLTGRRVPAADVAGLFAAVRHLELDAYFVPYASALAGAGAVPVLLTREASAAALVDRLDAIVLVGGADVDPATYGGRSNVHSTTHDPGLDAFEFALVRAALEADLPLLGICRGCQVLNVALGGTLVSHLPADAGEEHSDITRPLDLRRHRVRLAPDSVLGELYGTEVCTNSFHHQAVEDTGTGVRAVGWADDGVVEAIELPGSRALGVQWHPEMHPEGEHVLDWVVREASR
jgi:putative glutamine amidotransferase